VKNLLAIVPLLSSGATDDQQAWISSVAMFGAFCAMASSVYILNDISDLSADRQHPRKSLRPLASGALSVGQGLALIPPLWIAAIALGTYSGALPVLLLYGVTSVAYSYWLKEAPLVDVFALAGLYTLRLFGGGVASGHPVSLWLLAFSSFFFLSLALVKRVSELSRLLASKQVQVVRRGYSVRDLGILQTMGCGAAFVSSLVLSLYVQSDIPSRNYASPSLLWGVIPLLLFWQCRLWLSTARGYMHDDPIVYALRDRVSWAVLALLIVVVVAARLPFW
jgi:4-hydroxybenzoate polyprenyltransferase